MGFQSQTGHLGFKTQAAQGAYLSPGAVAPNNGIFVRTRSGSLGGNRDLLIPDPEIGGNRDIPDAQLGPIAYSGDIDMYLRMESLAFILKAVLGSAAAPSGTINTGFTHVITPSDVALPWISVEEKISNTFEAFRYTDCKFNTFHMEADATGYLMGTVGIIGLTQELEGAPTDISTAEVDISALIVGTNINVSYGGVDLKPKSFSLDINNNIEDDDFRLGSFFLGDAVEKRREITQGVTIRPEDSAMWRQAMWGGPAATQPGGLSFKDDAVITISSYEDIAGADPGTKYEASFTIPSAIIAPFNVEPSGDDVIENDLEIRAVRPSPGTPILTASVTNSLATLP